MKTRLIMIAALFLCMGCGKSDNIVPGHDHAHAHGHNHATSHGHTHGHDHGDAQDGGHEEGAEHSFGDEILLNPEVAEMFGVTTERIEPGTFSEVVPVAGMILDSPSSSSVVSAPTSGIVRFAARMQEGSRVSQGATVATVSSAGIAGGDRNRADEAALNAARRELERLQPLYESGIVSARDYNAAVQAYETAQAQYSPAAASGSAKAVSGGVISRTLVQNGEYVEAGTPIAVVSSNTRLTLRADVPDRYYNTIPLLTSARVRLPYGDTVIDLSELNGTRVNADGAGVRTSPGYIPVYFAFDNNGHAPANTVVDVYLIGSQRHNVTSVPLTAITEQQGNKFVYVRVDEEGYVKIPVTTGANDGRRVEILSGLQGGEEVVVTGAPAVRLAETSNVEPEGHTH